MKLTKKDTKLLHQLSLHSRATLKELSSSSGYSQETVQKKLKEFLQTSLLFAYSTHINISKIYNLQEYIGFINTQATSQETIQTLLHFLKTSKFTSWIGRGIGAYDIKIAVYVQNSKQIHEFEQELYSQFSNIIISIEWNQIIDKYKNTTTSIISYCLEDLPQPPPISKVRTTQHTRNEQTPFQLHPLQTQILYALSDNSRISLQELSATLNTTIENIHYHYKQLLKHNIIERFSICVNTTYFHKNSTIVLFKIRSSHIENIIQKIQHQPSVTSVLHVIGAYNIQVTMIHSSPQLLFDEIQNLQNIFYQEILEIQYFFIHSFEKFPKLPSILLEHS